MSIQTLNSVDFPHQLEEALKEAISDENTKVFQIIDSHAVIDREKIHGLLQEFDQQIVDHHYAVIETGKPIIDKVGEYPHAIHLWYDLPVISIFHPEVMKAFLKLTSGAIAFSGTFVLVSDIRQYTDGSFPPFPGVHIDLPNDVFIEYLEENIDDI